MGDKVNCKTQKSTSKCEKKNTDSGLSGQSYEVKICSYLLIEATRRLQINEIDNFYIASNMEKADLLDDVVFKYSFKDKDGNQKNRVTFIQTKHRLRESKHLTLEKLINTGDLQKYHLGYRAIRKHFLENITNDPVFSTPLCDMEMMFVTNVSLGGSKEDLRVYKYEDDNFLKFKDENVYYKLDVNIRRKFKNQETISLMDVLTEVTECQTFVEKLVQEICLNECGEKYDILTVYRKPILEELIDISSPGVGLLKSKLFQNVNRSPFEKCFLEKITKNNPNKSLKEIKLKLPKDFDNNQTYSDQELSLPYSCKYFKEFFDAFKICVDQKHESELNELIRKTTKQCFPIGDIEANDTSIVITANVKDWWEEKSEYINYLDKNSIISTCIEFSLRFNVKEPVPLFTGRTKKLDDLHNAMQSKSTCSGLGTVVHGLGTVVDGLGTVVDGLGTVVHGLGTVVDGLGTVVDGLGTVVDGLGTVVHGLGGIGKTEFTRKYIEKYGSSFNHNIVWINADDANTTVDSFLNLVKTKLTFLYDNEDLSDALIKKVLEYLSNKTCLIVFDNAENTKEFLNILSLVKRFKEWKPFIIITSRDTMWNDDVKTFQLSVLDALEAVDLVKRCLSIDNELEDDDIFELVKTLEYFPLALQQTISYIYYERIYENYSIKSYIEDFSTNKAALLDSTEENEIYDDYYYTTFNTWSITTNKIQSDPVFGETAIKIFRIIAYCSPNNIHKDIFSKLNNTTQQQINGALSLLTKYSMIAENNSDRSQFNVHRLVQEVTRLRLQQNVNGSEIDILNESLHLFVNSVDRKILDHVIVTWKFASIYEKLIRQFGYILKDILYALLKESRFQEGYRFAETALKELSQYFSSNHNYVIDVNIEFGKILVRLSKFDKATELYENLLISIPKEDDERTYKVKIQIGKVLSKTSKYSEALTQFKGLYEDVNKIFGPKHIFKLTVLEGIAVIYKRNGLYGESMEKFNKILEILKQEEKTPEVEFDMISAKANIASCLKYLGKYDEAVTIFKDILEFQLEKYGERHHMSLKTLNNISVVYVMQGKYYEGLETFNKSLSIKKKLYGDKSSSVLVTKHNIATIYLSLPPEKYEEGLKLLREVASERKDLLGISHRLTLNSYKKLAMMLYKMGKYDEAILVNQDAYDEMLKLHKNKENPNVIDIYRNMAKMYAAQCQNRKALEMLEEILDVQTKKKDFGENHPQTLQTMLEKANILGDIGREEEAIQILYEIQSKVLTTIGSDHSVYKDVINKLKRLENIHKKNLSTNSFVLRIIKQITSLFVVYVFYKICVLFYSSSED